MSLLSDRLPAIGPRPYGHSHGIGRQCCCILDYCLAYGKSFINFLRSFWALRTEVLLELFESGRLYYLLVVLSHQ
jgi:hypothetical protein